LLQGPPGTGKTHTLLGITGALYNYIKRSKNNFKKYLIICAPSNAAINEIILRILNLGLPQDNGITIIPKLVRIGIIESESPKQI